MILVFIILGIIILIDVLILILQLSTLQIYLPTLHIINDAQTLKIKIICKFSIYFLGKVKIFEWKITNQKLVKWLHKGKMNLQIFKSNPVKVQDSLKKIKYIPFTVKSFKLKGYFATEEPIFSSWIYVFIHSIFPILIAKKLQGKYENQLQFLKLSQNKINIKVQCIIRIKLVNIINILLKQNKKGGKKQYGKSSHRRPYAYSYE